MKLKGIAKNAAPILVKSVGAIGANYAQKLIPFGNDTVKAAIVAVGGIVLSDQKGFIGQIGEGLAIGGIQNAAKSMGIGNPDGPLFDFGLNGTDDGGILGTEDGGLFGTEYASE